MASVSDHKNVLWGLGLSFIVVVWIPATFAYRGSGYSGPYEIVVKSLGQCEDNGKGLIKLTSRISKVNQSHFAFDINWTIDVEFNDNLTGFIEVSQLTRTGWTPNAFSYISQEPCNDCEVYAKSVFHDFLSKAGLEPRCPIPKGSYKTSGLIIQGSLEEFQELPYGEYKLEVTYANERNVKIGCWRMIFVVNRKV